MSTIAFFIATCNASADITLATMQDINTAVASFFDGSAAFKTLYWQGIGFVPADEITATAVTAQGMPESVFGML